MLNNIFEIIFLCGFILACIIRSVMVFRIPQWWKNKDQITGGVQSTKDKLLMLPVSLGMFVIPFIYVFSTLLDFADYDLNSTAESILGWTGTVIFIAALQLLWKSHADLGRDFSPELNLRNDHTLITNGIFRFVRHPMYAAHLLWAIAQFGLLQNWIAGPIFLAFSIPLYLIRIPREEKMLLEHFGEDYRNLIKRTGRLIPRLQKLK